MLQQLALELLGVLHHRAELEHLELAAVTPDPRLAEEDGAREVSFTASAISRSIGASTSSNPVATMRSKARLRKREEGARPKPRTPISSRPPRSSKSTDVPITSSSRGRTATRTPEAVATNDVDDVVAGPERRRHDHALDLVLLDHREQLVDHAEQVVAELLGLALHGHPADHAGVEARVRGQLASRSCSPWRHPRPPARVRSR